MHRFLLIPLVLVLSGTPAAAVVCDLLLCAEAGIPAQNCHEHASPEAGDRVTSKGAPCSHLTSVDPYLSASRPLLLPVAWIHTLDAASYAPLSLRRLSQAPWDNGPPPAVYGTSSLPLRI